MSTAVPKEMCPRCRQKKPLTDQYWKYLDAGLDAVGPRIFKACLMCLKSEEEEAQIEANQKALDLIGQRSVEFLIKAESSGVKVPHTEEYLTEIMARVGGAAGLAALSVKHYHDCWHPDKYAQRTRMIEMWNRLIAHNSDEGGASKPDHLKTSDDLHEEMKAIVLRSAREVLLAEMEKKFGPEMMQQLLLSLPKKTLVIDEPR